MPVLSIMGESVDGLRNREECGILRLMRNSEFIIRNFGVRFADDYNNAYNRNSAAAAAQ